MVFGKVEINQKTKKKEKTMLENEVLGGKWKK